MEQSQCTSAILVDVEAARAQRANGQHTTAPADDNKGDNRLSLSTAPDVCLPSSQIEAYLLPGSQGLSQGLTSLLDLATQQTQDSLQQEMLRAERQSADREQSRAQEAAAALRGEAAQAADGPPAQPCAAVQAPGAGEADAMMVQVQELGGTRESPVVGKDAAAAAAAAGGAGPDQLEMLAQAAFDEQQQLLLQQQQQQYADPQWAAAAAAAAYAGMPMASWGQPGLMSGAYWPQCMQQQYTQRHSSLSKIEHAGSNAKRRGPMDEMRQLQRILTKLLPGSIIYMPNQDGGGNKIQADDIKVYLAATLGEAPKPDWGLKNGWGQYLADLFNWATARAGKDEITRMEAMACARRPQGRSWEVVFDKLMEMGIYSWNWELPLRHEQVLSCAKTPPPELTRQQEALAAATAAAAAAAAVTAGATPDAIPSLPVVARMATLLGKRQHQQMAPLPPMAMAPAMMTGPGLMYADMAAEGGAADAGGPVAAAAAAAEVDTTADVSEERAVKQQRSSSAGPSGGEASGSGAAPAAEGGAPAVPSMQCVSDAELATPPTEVLDAASMQQLLTYIDNALSVTLQAMQRKILSGTLKCPPMDFVNYMKHFKLDPLYASVMALTLQASQQQAAAEQQVAQQSHLQQLQQQLKLPSKVKAEAAGSSLVMDPVAAAAEAPVPAMSLAPAAAVMAGASAGAASSGGAPDATAAAHDSRSSGGAAGAADTPAEAAGDAQGLLVAPAAAQAAACGGSKPAVSAKQVTAALAAQKLQKPATKKSAASQQGLQQQLAGRQNTAAAVQAAAEEAMAAAAQQRQAAALTLANARLQRVTAENSHGNSEEAATAAAYALTALAGSQEAVVDVQGQQQQQQQQAGGSRAASASLQKRRVGNSRLANASSRAAHTPPMKAR